MKFKANEIFADYDKNEILIIGFLGKGFNDKQVYFLIQDSIEYDDQDRELGMDNYYIEKNDQSMGCYGGINKLRLFKNRIQIDLNKKGIQNLKETNFDIEFECECDSDEFENLQRKLNQVFSNGELLLTS